MSSINVKALKRTLKTFYTPCFIFLYVCVIPFLLWFNIKIWSLTIYTKILKEANTLPKNIVDTLLIFIINSIVSSVSTMFIFAHICFPYFEYEFHVRLLDIPTYSTYSNYYITKRTPKVNNYHKLKLGG
jgi:hypothetical protein